MKTLQRQILFTLAAASALVAASAFAGGPNPMYAPPSGTPGHAVAFGAQPYNAVDSGKAFPSGAIVGTSDTQTLTGKSIDASEVNSGTLNIARLPALTSGSALLQGNGSGFFSNVTIGSGLSLVSGTLSNTSPGAVASVFGRTGAVVAASNDYTFAQIGSKPTTLAGYGITDALVAANNLSDLTVPGDARANLGLAIGGDVEAWSADLDALAAASVDGAIYYRVGAGDWEAVTPGAHVSFTGGTLDTVGLLVAASNLSDVASPSTARTNLGLAIGSNVQAWDADLDALAALTGTNNIYYRSAANTWTPVTIGTGLSFGSGTLANSHVDAVSSVFGRTGAVVAASNDYTFAQLASTPTTLAGYGITDGLVKGNNLSDLTNATTARSNLGAAIGSNVEAWNADLDAIAALIPSNVIYYRAAPGDWEPVTIGTNLSFISGVLNASGGGGGAVSSVFGRTGAVVAASNDYTFAQLASTPTTLAGYGITDALARANNLSDVASASTARSNLGVAIGSNVQAWDADLDALAALTGTNNIYYRSAANTWTSVTIGTGLGFSGGTLSNTSLGAVTSVFGRTGAVVAAANDYDFSLLSGSAACSQLPALTGAVNSSAGSCSTTIPNGVFTNQNQTFSKAQRSAVVALSLSTATFTPNFDNGQNFSAALVHATCPCTMANPSTTLVAGQSGIIEIDQSSTGSDLITWGSEYIAAGGVTTIVLSTGANAKDYISYYVPDTSHVLISMGAASATH